MRCDISRMGPALYLEDEDENRRSPQITADQHNVILKPPQITGIAADHRRSA